MACTCPKDGHEHASWCERNEVPEGKECPSPSGPDIGGCSSDETACIPVAIEAIEPIRVVVLRLDTEDFYFWLSFGGEHHMSAYHRAHEKSERDAGAAAATYLRQLRERIDLTLAELDRKGGA